ncbi:MAG: CvpA family protein [Ruminiclostridium sp.]|nr:CvpA family protein [Ruminiclostridium sp.]
MTLTTSLVLDIVLVGLLVYWFLMGLRKGLILSLCGLIAVLLGLAGGWYLATTQAAPLAAQWEPFFTRYLTAEAALPATRALLFLGGFVVVQMIWTALCHILDLVAKLPGLNVLNKSFGGILGLVKGILILLVAQWALVDLLGWIPAEVASQSRVLLYLDLLTQVDIRGILALPF